MFLFDMGDVLKSLGIALFLVVCFVIFASGSGNGFQAIKESPSVYLVPGDLTGIEVGDYFDVYVNVVNAEALYGFDLAFV